MSNNSTDRLARKALCLNYWILVGGLVVWLAWKSYRDLVVNEDLVQNDNAPSVYITTDTVRRKGDRFVLSDSDTQLERVRRAVEA